MSWGSAGRGAGLQGCGHLAGRGVACVSSYPVEIYSKKVTVIAIRSLA